MSVTVMIPTYWTFLWAELPTTNWLSPSLATPEVLLRKWGLWEARLPQHGVRDWRCRRGSPLVCVYPGPPGLSQATRPFPII